MLQKLIFSVSFILFHGRKRAAVFIWLISWVTDSESTAILTCSLGIFVTFQEGRNVSELRDAILSVATLFLQLLQTFQELPAGQTGVDTSQLLVNRPPLKTTPHHHNLQCVLNHLPPCICIHDYTLFSPCWHFFCCILHHGQLVAPVTKEITVWMMLSVTCK